MKFLDRKRNLITLIVVMALGLGMLFRAFVLPALDGGLAAVISALVLSLTNDARSAKNLAKLNPNPLLDLAAQAKAEDMAAKSYFAHLSPDGTLPWQWIDRTGYQYIHAGENLALNFDDSERVVNAWMQSPTHRFNILKREYTDIGIGQATGTYMGKPATFVVQMFATPIK